MPIFDSSPNFGKEYIKDIPNESKYSVEKEWNDTYDRKPYSADKDDII